MSDQLDRAGVKAQIEQHTLNLRAFESAEEARHAVYEQASEPYTYQHGMRERAAEELSEAAMRQLGYPPMLVESLLAALTALSEAQEKRGELEEALGWYGEQSRLCRLIHSAGDVGRNALSRDGGQRARLLLGSEPSDGE